MAEERLFGAARRAAQETPRGRNSEPGRGVEQIRCTLTDQRSCRQDGKRKGRPENHTGTA